MSNLLFKTNEGVVNHCEESKSPPGLDTQTDQQAVNEVKANHQASSDKVNFTDYFQDLASLSIRVCVGKEPGFAACTMMPGTVVE